MYGIPKGPETILKYWHLGSIFIGSYWEWKFRINSSIPPWQRSVPFKGSGTLPGYGTLPVKTGSVLYPFRKGFPVELSSNEQGQNSWRIFDQADTGPCTVLYGKINGATVNFSPRPLLVSQSRILINIEQSFRKIKVYPLTLGSMSDGGANYYYFGPCQFWVAEHFISPRAICPRHSK